MAYCLERFVTAITNIRCFPRRHQRLPLSPLPSMRPRGPRQPPSTVRVGRPQGRRLMTERSQGSEGRVLDRQCPVAGVVPSSPDSVPLGRGGGCIVPWK